MIVAEMNARVTEIIFRDRASLTLLHYLDGRDLSQRGIEKLTEAVSVMKDKCVSLGVDAAYLISTAALRAVTNFEEVGAAILNRTGLPVNAVDGQTEAYCDFIALRSFMTSALFSFRVKLSKPTRRLVSSAVIVVGPAIITLVLLWHHSLKPLILSTSA